MDLDDRIVKPLLFSLINSLLIWIAVALVDGLGGDA